jgi:O-antigen/teichoic acid export membrane protein
VSAAEPPFEGFADLELEAAESGRAARVFLRGSAWLMASMVAGAVGGLLFWVVAAHVARPPAVGRSAALYTAILFINYATSLGLGIPVARYCRSDSSDDVTTFTAAIVLSGASSVLAALLFVALAPHRVVAPIETMGSAGGILVFCAIAASMAITALTDVRLIALRRWSWVFYRALAVSVARLLVLAVLPDHPSALSIFLVLTGIPALSGLLTLPLMSRFTRVVELRWPLSARVRDALRFALANYVPMLAEQAPLLVLPIIVLVSVGSTQNAHFYVAWGATSFMFLVPAAVAQILLVEGGRDGAALPKQTRLALVLNVSVMSAATVLTFLARGLVTVVYGPKYGEAATILPELVAGTISYGISAIAVTRARIDHDARAALVMTGTFALAVLVPAMIWTPHAGIEGAAHAWLIGSMVGAIVSLGYLHVRNWLGTRSTR